MEENKRSDTTFNIYGGTVQILPNATKAELHIHTGGMVSEVNTVAQQADLSSEGAQRLRKYIDKVEDLQGYLSMLAACTTAKEIGEVVAIMFEKEAKLTRDSISKGSFISQLPLLAPKVTKGLSIDNLRIHIDNAVETFRKATRSSRRPDME